MRRVGLTGGIGSGKSEVTRRLAARGAFVIDADVVAREVVAPGTPGLAAVVEEFGDDVLDDDGALDRPALGRRVFGDDEARARLNGIVHPLVGERTAELLDEAPDGALVVHDVPLLVENGLAPAYDAVVVIDAPDEVRLERLVELRGMTRDDAQARMAAQASREERLAVADHVVDNSGPLDALDEAVADLWEQLDVAPETATSGSSLTSVPGEEGA